MAIVSCDEVTSEELIKLKVVLQKRHALTGVCLRQFLLWGARWGTHWRTYHRGATSWIHGTIPWFQALDTFTLPTSTPKQASYHQICHWTTLARTNNFKMWTKSIFFNPAIQDCLFEMEFAKRFKSCEIDHSTKPHLPNLQCALYNHHCSVWYVP